MVVIPRGGNWFVSFDAIRLTLYRRMRRIARPAAGASRAGTADLLKPLPRIVTSTEAAIRVVGDEDWRLAVLSPTAIEFLSAFPARILTGEGVDDPTRALQRRVTAGKWAYLMLSNLIGVAEVIVIEDNQGVAVTTIRR